MHHHGTHSLAAVIDSKLKINESCPHSCGPLLQWASFNGGFGFAQTDLAGLFLKAGVKNQRVALLLTDAQIPDERFLVIINDLLASGWKENGFIPTL